MNFHYLSGANNYNNNYFNNNYSSCVCEDCNEAYNYNTNCIVDDNNNCICENYNNTYNYNEISQIPFDNPTNENLLKKTNEVAFFSLEKKEENRVNESDALKNYYTNCYYLNTKNDYNNRDVSISDDSVSENSLEKTDKVASPHLMQTESLKRKNVEPDTLQTKKRKQDDKNPASSLIGLENVVKQEIINHQPAKQKLEKVSFLISDQISKNRIWSKDENKKLMELVSSKQSKNKETKINWKKIAELLNTGKTNRQCYSKWKRNLSKNSFDLS